MTEEEFKETEVYKLLMNDTDIKFGTMVNTLLPHSPYPPLPCSGLENYLSCLSSS